MLPFTQSEFFAVFAKYNIAIWPAQLVLVGAAAGAVAAVRRPNTVRIRVMLGVLSALWLWMAIVYHGIFFRPINPAAMAFAALFVVESGLLAFAALRPSFDIRPRPNIAGVVGWTLIAFALIIYPLIGYFAGHRYPAMPTFGLPCPTTIFTLGVLLWSTPMRVSLLIVPLLWALIGFSAALQLGVYQDTGLLIAAAATVTVLMKARRRSSTMAIAT